MNALLKASWILTLQRSLERFFENGADLFARGQSMRLVPKIWRIAFLVGIADQSWTDRNSCPCTGRPACFSIHHHTSDTLFDVWLGHLILRHFQSWPSMRQCVHLPPLRQSDSAPDQLIADRGLRPPRRPVVAPPPPNLREIEAEDRCYDGDDDRRKCTGRPLSPSAGKGLWPEGAWALDARSWLCCWGWKNRVRRGKKRKEVIQMTDCQNNVACCFAAWLAPKTNWSDEWMNERFGWSDPLNTNFSLRCDLVPVGESCFFVNITPQKKGVGLGMGSVSKIALSYLRPRSPASSPSPFGHAWNCLRVHPSSWALSLASANY